MTDRRPLLTELDALDCVHDILNVVLEKLPDPDHVITGALVIGVYQVNGYTQVKTIGDMDYWKQIGIHTDCLDRLKHAEPHR